MLNFFKNKKRPNISHFKNLVVVAYADGKLDTNEREFLSQRAKALGISEDLVEEILTNASGLSFETPNNDTDKEEQLTDAVFLSIADGEVHETEYGICVSFAKKLGFDQQKVDETIDYILTSNDFEEE